jgi:hypothetical protein
LRFFEEAMRNFANIFLSKCVFVVFFAGCLVAKESNEIKKTIDSLFKGKTGFGINKKEIDLIVEKGSKATYGEILYDSMQTLINDLKLTKNDVFYDLGSGIGKQVVQVYLATKVKKSCGIELSKTRFDYSEQVKNEMKKRKLIDRRRVLDFKYEDIVESDISDATVVYMCSTCYPAKLMENLTRKLENGKKNLRILTLKVLAKSKKFKLKKTYTLPMTWSKASNVYLYELT